MSKKTNKRKESFLQNIPIVSLDSSENIFASKCKFNFSFFDSNQSDAKNYNEITNNQLCKILNKINFYCKEPLSHWENERIGGASNKVFSIYGAFPKKTNYKVPLHVPHQAEWARFRLEGALRLIGFVVPENYHDKLCIHSGVRFDRNTFYLVYIDPNHKFYLS